MTQTDIQSMKKFNPHVFADSKTMTEDMKFIASYITNKYSIGENLSDSMSTESILEIIKTHFRCSDTTAREVMKQMFREELCEFL